MPIAIETEWIKIPRRKDSLSSCSELPEEVPATAPSTKSVILFASPESVCLLAKPRVLISCCPCSACKSPTPRGLFSDALAMLFVGPDTRRRHRGGGAGTQGAEGGGGRAYIVAELMALRK